jgi:putative PEP-CTERM system TPR-repeat lipoprotein
MLGVLAASGQASAEAPPLPHAQANSADTEDAAVKALLLDAEKALRGGNGRLALIHLKNAVRIAPANAAARTQLGIVQLQVGNAPAAESQLRQARKDGAPHLLVLPPLFQAMLLRNETQLLLEQFPDPGAGTKEPEAADILAARALAFQRLGRLPEAIDAMDRSLKLRRDPRGLLIRARLALQQGDRRAAGGFADDAIQRSSHDPEAMIFKAELLLDSGESAEALKLADQLASKFPDSLSGHLARIEVFFGQKQDAKAKTVVDDILAKNPKEPMANYYRGLLLARAGDAKGAWAYAQTVPSDLLDAWPNMAILISQMAENAGRIDTGAAILSRVLQKNPDLLAVRLRLATIRIQQDSPFVALSVLGPVKNSSDPKVVALLSRVHFELDRINDKVNTLPRPNEAQGQSDVAPPKNGSLPLPTAHTDQGIKELAQAVSKQPTNAALVLPLIKALTQLRHFPEALTAADRLATDPKQRATALTFRGDILTLQHDASGAQAAFDEAVKIEPHNRTALHSRARALLAAQRYPEAGRDFRAILLLDPKDMTALLGSAEIAARQSEDRNVRQILNKAIALAPQSDPPRLALIRYLMARRDFAEALIAANDLVRLRPANVDGVALRGQVQSALGDKKGAVASFRHLVAMAPAAAEPQILLSKALFTTGDRAGAARALESAIKLNPSSVNVRSAQISLQLAQGNADAAVASAQSFQKSNPGSDTEILLADTLVKANHADQALKVLTKSFADKPNSAVLLRLMRMAISSNDSKRAEDLVSKWLAGHPDDTAVRLDYAAALLQMGDNTRATAQYEKILKQDSHNTTAMNNLGWLLQSSDPKRALSLLTLASNLSPNSPEVADTLGWVKIQQKDVAGGLNFLNRAHGLRPQDGEITYHLVVALDANSDRKSARGLLKALLASGTQFPDRPAAVRLASAWN